MRLIDVDELKNALIECTPYAIDPVYRNTNSNIDMFTVMEILDELPTIDAVPVVRGEWRTWEEQFPDRTTRKKNNLGVFCSACQLHADNMTSYCPNCGAKME